jgi:hypothetical protein
VVPGDVVPALAAEAPVIARGTMVQMKYTKRHATLGEQHGWLFTYEEPAGAGTGPVWSFIKSLASGYVIMLPNDEFEAVPDEGG